MGGIPIHFFLQQHKCPMCKIAHALYKCDKFRNTTLQDRRALVTRCNLCFNCMQEGHRASECTNSHRCRQCKKHHHTLLRQNHREQILKAPEIEQILQSLRSRLRLLQNQDKEATVVSKNNVRLKLYLPQPQSRSRTHGVLNSLAEFYMTAAHNQVMLLKPLHSDCN